MTPSQTPSTSEPIARSNYEDHRIACRSAVSWGAIIAGTIAALALHVLFMMLGTGLGFAIYNPITTEEPVANLGVGALLIHSICAITALFFGGWIAGRLSPTCARATGCLHGFSVWASATVAGVIMVAMGAGAMLGGLGNLVGESLSAVTKPVAAVAGGAVDIAADAIKQSDETVLSFIDEAVSNRPEDSSEGEGIRAKREIGFAVGRLFNPAQEGNTPENRDAAVSALEEHTGMSEDEADRAITEWTSSFEGLQQDLAAAKESAARKAREAADATASALAKISMWAFIGFLLGACVATLGGHLGVICARKCAAETDFVYPGHDRPAMPRHQAPNSGV